MKPEEVMLATQHLSFFLENGVNIVAALQALAGSASPPARRVLEQISQAVEQGHPLSQAFSAQPESFGPGYLRSLRAAEKTGRLVSTLRSLAGQMEKQLATRRRLKSAFTYPLCVMTAAGLMIAFLLYVQVPIFLGIFRETGVPLPGLTQALIVISRPQFGLLLLLVTLSAAVYLKVLSATREGRRALSSWLYGWPVLGSLLQLAAFGEFANQLSGLLCHGVDLLTSLRCLAQGESGAPCLEALPQVAERVTEGSTLSEALEREGAFPPLLLSLLRAGEETGRPWQGLQWYGDLALQELEDRLDLLLQLIEPLIMGVLGLVVTFIALACFMPTYQLLLQN